MAQSVNWDRVYEVYRWWVNVADGDASRSSEKTHLMGSAEQQLLDQIIDDHGTGFRAAFNYRSAQKSGADRESLARFNPTQVGLGDQWSEGQARTNFEVENKIFLRRPTAPLSTATEAAEPTRAGVGLATPGGYTQGVTGGGGESGGTDESERTGPYATPEGYVRGDAPIIGTAIRRFDATLQARLAAAFGAATQAAARRRTIAKRGGRQSTILGGFRGGTPTTQRATLIGR